MIGRGSYSPCESQLTATQERMRKEKRERGKEGVRKLNARLTFRLKTPDSLPQKWRIHTVPLTISHL